MVCETSGIPNCCSELTTGSRSQSFSHLTRSKHVRRKPIVLSVVFVRPFHENYGCSFRYVFQSSKANGFGSVCIVDGTFDRPDGQKALHKHVGMQSRPWHATVAKICVNHLMPGENRSVGVMISRECAKAHNMLYTVTFCRIDKCFALH